MCYVIYYIVAILISVITLLRLATALLRVRICLVHRLLRDSIHVNIHRISAEGKII